MADAIHINKNRDKTLFLLAALLRSNFTWRYHPGNGSFWGRYLGSALHDINYRKN